MPLFNKSTQLLSGQIDEFLDAVAEGGLVFRKGVYAYLEGDAERFDHCIQAIRDLEHKADDRSKSVETHLYRHSLIPEHRGDVLGLLETTDTVIDTAKSALVQFSVEKPVIPADCEAGFAHLVDASNEALQAVVIAARTFFRDPEAIKDHLFKVAHYEHEADGISDALKRHIFAGNLDLAHKIHLRYFARNIEMVSDRSQDVADRLAIYAIKRSL
jgi:predicted phosphate transport protein (TIGR00153 family)